MKIQDKQWWKKQWSNVLLFALLILLLIPQTGRPIKVFVHRLIAFSPSEIKEDKREMLSNYDWRLRDMQGNSVDFNAFQGKKILVNFWATWCPPCIAEMPSMQALYNDYKDEVVFLFVTNDDNNTVSGFLQKNNYQLPVYTTVTAPVQELESSSLPTTCIIDEEGSIVIRKVGSADWNSASVRELLEK